MSVRRFPRSFSSLAGPCVAACAALAAPAALRAQPAEVASAVPVDAAAVADVDQVTFAPIADTPEPAIDEGKSSSRFSCNTRMGLLLDNPETRTVLKERIPDVVDSPQIFMARGLTLRQLAGHRRAGITPQVLAELDTDLAALP